MADIPEMGKIKLTRFADAKVTEQALRAVADGGWSDPEVGVPCAWLLRQSHQEKAVHVCQALLSAHGDAEQRRSLSDEQRGYVILTLAEAAHLHARWDQAAKLASEAEEHFRVCRSASGLSDALFVRASIVGERQDGEERRALIEMSLQEAEGSGDRERCDTSWLTLQIFKLFSGERPEVSNLARIRQMTLDSNCGVRALAHCFFMSFDLEQANPVSAAEHGLQAQANAMEAGFLSRAIMDGSNVGVILCDLEDLDGSLAQCQPILDLARKVGWPVCVSATSSIIALTLSKLGRHEGALLLAKEAVDASSVQPNSRNHLNCVHAAAECALALDDLEVAEAWYSQVRDNACGAEGGQLRGYAALGLGKVFARTGRPREAVEMAHQALEWGTSAGDAPCRVDALRLLAQVASGPEQSAVTGSSAVELLQQAVNVASNASESAVNYRLLRELAGALEVDGRHEEAITALKESMRRLEIARAGEADRRGAALEVRYRTELAVAEAEGMRKTAELQAAKAAELEVLNRQLRSAMAELEATQALLVSRNEELTAAYARISDLSIRDPLTGLHNRRFFEEAIEAAVSEARRAYRPSAFGDLEPVQRAQGRDLLFFMLDMDHFKTVNDQYGHAAGDALLIQLRDRLRGVVRELDFLIRWGGEEFLLAFRGVSREEGKLLAERLLLAVSCAPFVLPGGVKLSKTVSIGYAAFPQDVQRPHEGSWEAVVELADARLYAAKRKGRNAAVGDPADGEAQQSMVVRGHAASA